MKVDRVVFDTSTLLSALLFRNSVPGQALDKALDSCTLFISDYTERELVDVVGRKKFDRYSSFEQRIEVVANFISKTVKIDNVAFVDNNCRDPKDVPFLELGVAANVDLIVSSDSDLLDLDPFNSIRIIKPADFLAL